MRRISLSSALLSKLAKHVAVLVCLAIAGNATHRFVIGQMSIFLLAVLAALLHSAGRRLHGGAPLVSLRHPFHRPPTRFAPLGRPVNFQTKPRGSVPRP